MIDPATGWFEVAAIAQPDSDCVMQAFDDTWLTHYPRPQYIGFDGGSEFKLLFKQMCANYGLKRKQSSKYNPQSNGIAERVHQVLGDMLRTFELEERELQKENPWTPFLSSAAFAIRSTYHTTLEATPAQLVFGRDMILPVQFQADCNAIQQRRQRIINKSNERENKTRIAHEYKVGDKVTRHRHGKQPKLRTRKDGPLWLNVSLLMEQ
jgi:hypothetical protein